MKKGFTLLEIVIAVTLLGIISAVIIPNFTNSTDKARLKSDIQSAQVVQSAIDLYNIEQNDYINESNFDEVVLKLYDNKYLKHNKYSPQTKDSSFKILDSIIKVDISNTSNKDELYNELSEQEQYYIIK